MKIFTNNLLFDIIIKTVEVLKLNITEKYMFGLRPDGKKVKNIDPVQKIMPHLMPTRNDS